MKILDRLRTLGSQYVLMLWKDGLVTMRGWKSTMLQIACPVGFVLMLLLCQVVPTDDADYHPPERLVTSGVPECSGSKSCVSLAWAYDQARSPSESSLRGVSESEALNVMSRVAQNARRYANSTELQADLVSNLKAGLNLTQAAVVWYAADVATEDNATFSYGNLTAGDVRYTVLYNETNRADQIFERVQSAVDSALGSFMAERAAIASGAAASEAPRIAGSVKAYPFVRSDSSDAIGMLGAALLFCPAMFSWMSLLFQLVQEKELRLRETLRAAGLSEVAYWASVMTWYVALVLVQSAVQMAVGAACQFRFFLNANQAVVYLNFVILGVSLAPLAVLLSTLLPTTKAAVNAGMGVFLVGMLVEVFLCQSGVVQLFYDPSSTIAAILKSVLQFWQPFNFAKVVANVAKKTPQSGALSNEFYRWSDLTRRTRIISDPVYYVPSDLDSWWHQLASFLVFSGLSAVLILVMPSQGAQLTRISQRVARMFRARRNTVVQDETSKRPDEDEDVASERAMVHGGTCKAPLQIKGLHKVYRRWGTSVVKSAKDVHAVRGLSLAVAEGELFALLGHNGAGKTSTFAVLTGLQQPSSGDAVIYGHSALDDISGVRRIAGVCPQHDVLWPELTAREHLRLFGRLRGMSSSDLDTEVDQRLSDVLLLDVGDHKSSTFSGGMKRRLSLAIACIAKPRVLLLDEPTTGLDPVSRRHVWSAIQRMKEGRVVVLTTHSMEEADALGDRVGIMAQGELRCLGTPLHLKTKYGLGYVLNVTSQESRVEEAMKYVQEVCPDARMLAKVSGSLKFCLSSDLSDQMVRLLARVEEDGEKGEESCPILDWSTTQTTLEEVFLSVRH